MKEMKYFTEANFGIEQCEDNHLVGNTIMLTSESIYGLETGLPLYPKEFVAMLGWHRGCIIRKGFEYNHNGCNQKCPCKGRWINCNRYTDITTKLKRLKRKQLDPEIREWYNDHFRIDWTAGNHIANG